jgi:hypothetical protein
MIHASPTVRMNALRHTLGILCSACAAMACIPLASDGGELYFTDFEEFTAGADQWVGTNGWLGNSVGYGVHGVDDGIVPALDKTAFLGGNPPASRFVSVFRPVNVYPLTNGFPLVEFESLMGIEDSWNGRYDSFYFSFYNASGMLLASVRFSNDLASSGLWRLDGVSQFYSDLDFTRGQLHLLFAEIDFPENQWSAYLDGIPIFTQAVFNASGQTRSLGSVAAEWRISGASTASYGDNWMLVADWSVRAYPVGEMPFLVQSVSQTSENVFAMSWTGQPGFEYRVERTQDFLAWRADIPKSTFTNIASTQTLTCADPASTGASNRFYRVLRTFAP